MASRVTILRITVLRITVVGVFLLGSVAFSRAGGPAFVAGSGYNPGVEGQALVWANDSVEYFTDQGSLSPILTGAQADAFVANAFSTWTAISGGALTASQAGHLAEDVNGSNIETNGFGVVTAPADIISSATGTPLGIVYDYDGTVTNAILGEGAGDLDDCFTNAVYGGPDNFAPTGNLVHALVVINGICAAASAQLPDVQYRLVRVLGRSIGLGWSQANVNVLTQKPPPVAADFAGFPVMHFSDPISCVPITLCYPNPSAPAMDDMDSLARLYPPISNPQAAGRIYGSVYFTDTSGNAVQPMQGVNVVARLLVAGEPSRQYVATSVSGFSFCGIAGNIIDGYVDADGLLYNRWGSDDTSLEGFFDLGQLMIPAGQTIAEYQLSVEVLDPSWSMGVESYAPNQVTPSGGFAPVVVTVTNGSNAERDILMLQDEIAEEHPGSGSTYANPAALPQGGAWGSWISGYGSTDFFQFTAQANRTASIVVTALNESGAPTETKLMPVIGIWELSDETGNPAPASTPSAFNTTTFAMTRLDAEFSTTETFRLAVEDFRGDGRPDYFYQASLLYSDTVTPARLSVAGGVTTLRGLGFSPALQVSFGGGINNGAMLSASASQIQVAAPAGSADGVANIEVSNMATGAFSQMIGALTYGASASDLLLLLQGAEPSTAVGAQADNPIRVRAVAADGVTPVNGATIAWSSTNGLQFSVCNRATFCSVLSDESGEASSWVTPAVTGPSTITIALAPASYSPPQLQQATVVGTSTTLDLAAISPTRWIGQGATIVVPLTVEALDLGAPKANVTVNFILTQGTASLSAGSVITNGTGLATVTASITNQNSNVQVTACVVPNQSPCQTFTLFSTPASLWTLQTVSGSSQFVMIGELFQPLIVRVTDGSVAENPVMGVNVGFATTLSRLGSDPIILGSSQTQIASAQDGTASIVPSAENVGPCAVFISATAGALTAQFQMESLALIVPELPGGGRGVKAPGGATPPRFGVQSAALQSLPGVLFAVPEFALADGPIVDPSNADPSNASSNEPATDPGADPNIDMTNDSGKTPALESGGAPNDPRKAIKKDALAEGIASNAALSPAPNPTSNLVLNNGVTAGATKNTSSNRPIESGHVSVAGFPDDKRSCQVLAASGPFF
jgi:hypothetical protein